MDKVCSNCGNVIPEGTAFCTECGTPAPKSEDKPKKEKKPKKDITVDAKANVKSKKDFEVDINCDVKDADESKNTVEKTPISDNVFRKEKGYVKPLHSVAYFFLMLLFAIPLVGLIASVAMSASSKNENLANFGKAVFVWKIIFIVITVVVLIVVLVFLHNKGITFGLIGQTFSDALASLTK